MPTGIAVKKRKAGLKGKKGLTFSFRVVQDSCFGCLDWKRSSRESGHPHQDGCFWPQSAWGAEHVYAPKHSVLVHSISGHCWSNPAGPMWPQPQYAWYKDFFINSNFETIGSWWRERVSFASAAPARSHIHEVFGFFCKPTLSPESIGKPAIGEYALCGNIRT